MTGAGTAKVGAAYMDVRAIRALETSAGTVVLERGELESVVERGRSGVRDRGASFDDHSGIRNPLPARSLPWQRPKSWH